LSAEIDKWGRAARNCTLLTVSNDVITEETQATNSFGGTVKRVEMQRNVVHRLDNRWPKRIMTWSPGGRRRRGRSEVKWGKEFERVMKQRKLL